MSDVLFHQSNFPMVCVCHFRVCSAELRMPIPRSLRKEKARSNLISPHLNPPHLRVWYTYIYMCVCIYLDLTSPPAQEHQAKLFWLLSKRLWAFILQIQKIECGGRNMRNCAMLKLPWVIFRVGADCAVCVRDLVHVYSCQVHVARTHGLKAIVVVFSHKHDCINTRDVYFHKSWCNLECHARWWQ